MHVIRYPSLELNWLPNSVKKGLPIPPLAVTDEEEYSGLFYHPKEGEYLYGVSLDKGLIVVSSYCALFESTIAHEYRHFWQLYNGKLGPGNDHWMELFQSEDTYKEAIIGYFTTQADEMDALCFERKLAPNDHTEQWWEWIIKGNCSAQSQNL